MPDTKSNESRIILCQLTKVVSDIFKIRVEGIKLVIFSDYSWLCKHLGLDKSKLPFYAVGFFKNKTIYVLEKSLFPTKGHPESEFDGVILHELCHVYFQKLIKTKVPIWVEEGFCNYSSFPEAKATGLADLNKINTLDDWHRYNTPFAYCSGFFFFLERRFGKKSILNFLHKLGKASVENAFGEAFKSSLSSLEVEYRGLVVGEKAA